MLQKHIYFANHLICFSYFYLSKCYLNQFCCGIFFDEDLKMILASQVI